MAANCIDNEVNEMDNGDNDDYETRLLVVIEMMMTMYDVLVVYKIHAYIPDSNMVDPTLPPNTHHSMTPPRIMHSSPPNPFFQRSPKSARAGRGWATPWCCQSVLTDQTGADPPGKMYCPHTPPENNVLPTQPKATSIQVEKKEL